MSRLLRRRRSIVTIFSQETHYNHSCNLARVVIKATVAASVFKNASFISLSREISVTTCSSIIIVKIILVWVNFFFFFKLNWWLVLMASKLFESIWMLWQMEKHYYSKAVQLEKQHSFSCGGTKLINVSSSEKEQKKRIRWTEDLHKKFIECVDRLGGAKSK